MKNWPLKNFKPKELLGPMYLEMYETRGLIYLDLDAANTLQLWRDRIGHPLWINHGWLHNRGSRHPDEHAKLRKKAKHSFHILGCAFDVSCDELTPEELYEDAKTFGWTGVGVYDTFVHVDTRKSIHDKVFTWDNRGSRA